MKICVISSSVFSCPPSGYSGLELVAWQIAKGLADKKHEVFLVAPDNSYCEGATVWHTGPPGQHSEQQAYDKIWPKLLEMDCIIDHSWAKWSMMLKAEGRLKAPCLCVMHAPINTMISSLPPDIDKPCFVCISQDQGNHFEAIFSKPVRVAQNGINTDFYKPMNIARSNRYLFLARFSTIKGPHFCIEACKDTNTELDLVGDVQITQEPEYLEQCKRMCDGKKIKLIGGVPRGECVYWFSQAKALLHANKLFREPLGLAPLEAMACGAPCIAFNFGAMRETIKDGETGFLVDSLDEMKSLIKNDAVSSLNRNRCRDWVVDNFSLQKMIDRYEQLCIEAKDGGGW